jgi:RNA polymerase sigma-70 factor (ECF subfamily)
VGLPGQRGNRQRLPPARKGCNVHRPAGVDPGVAVAINHSPTALGHAAGRPMARQEAQAIPIPEAVVSTDERLLIARLRARDEAACMEVVDRLHATLVRLATRYLGDRDAAEEVAQETWMAMLRGIDRFEGRSSLKTWIFRILTNQAFSRRARDAKREIPFSQLAAAEADEDAPVVDPSRFHRIWPLNGTWRRGPSEWGQSPEELAVSAETRAVIDAAIRRLPPAQETVIVLRDIHGMTSEEVCEALGITAVNQRVLLHRARARVRAALEAHLERA